MARKRKLKKKQIVEQIQYDLGKIYENLDRSEDFIYENTVKNWVTLAIQMYDVNRLSARVLCALKQMGLPVKLDLNYMDYYQDDLYGKPDFGEYIELEFVDMEEKDGDER